MEALQRFAVAGERRREHLDRHVAVQTPISGAVNLPHAADAEYRDHFVGTEASARGKTHLLREAGQL